MNNINEQVIKIITMLALIIILIVFFGSMLVNGVNKQIDNQSVMLCESAKKSKNTIYLNKCSVYYETGDIEDFKY